MFCKNCGKEIMDEAVVCIHCGCSTQDKPAKPAKQDAPNIGMAIIGFLIPLAGLIIWGVCKNEQPLMAKSAGKGALIGFIASIAMSAIFTVLYILYFVFLMAMMGM